MTIQSVRPWWQRAVFYQVYPPTFLDSSGNGVGDLAGIISRLDYLVDLGVDAIWLSPHYPSPMFDCGYDIADYQAVAPEYGSLDDFRRLLDEVHRRGMRLINDLVLNHTSDQHPWFLQSRASRDHPKRDWYIWRDGVDGGPPNDWLSTFGGSAWEFDTLTGQFYYHYFFREQPDLNWRNDEVRKAMFDVVRFWLDMGVDGFRLDAIGTIYEDASLESHKTGLSWLDLWRGSNNAHTERERERQKKRWMKVFGRQVDQPEVHTLMKELRALVNEYGERVLLGETENVAFYGDGTDELHLVFNFPLMKDERLTSAGVRANQAERLAALPPGAWPCNTLGNHDSPRVYNRFGDGKHDAQLARLSIALILTLRGTASLYYGEEIGMVDLYLDDIARFRDQLGVWMYQILQSEGGKSPAEALKLAARYTRDKCRTPMQWDDGPNGGFCPADVQPWLPVHPNHKEGTNVSNQLGNRDSLLTTYRSLLRVRRGTPALLDGDYSPLQVADPDLLVFERRTDSQSCLVALNFATGEKKIEPAADLPARGRVLFGTHRTAAEGVKLSDLAMSPFEILIVETDHE
jgi:alpha-glucosidase